MFSIFKSLFKTTLIGTAVIGTLAGGALLLAGPGRTQAVLHQVRTRVAQVIDQNIDDPVALRNNLRELEREYPKRIATLRADLAELNHQIHQLDRERAISLRVVELADQDLAVLRPMLDRATVSVAGNNHARLAAVSFDDKVYSVQRASTKVRRIQNTRSAHSNRAADADHSLTYLRQQLVRFEEAMSQLEAERAEFQIQLFQLNRQVDSIQRNERLIEMLADRKRTLEECTSYDVSSLDQITGKLEQILIRQAAHLDVLSSVQEAVNYEDMAREQLNDEQRVQEAVESFDFGPALQAGGMR